jgi:hypothetical protein
MTVAREIPIRQSPSLQHTQINARWPSYGDTLPDADTTPDASLFVLMPGKVLYQLQAGTWEALT